MPIALGATFDDEVVELLLEEPVIDCDVLEPLGLVDDDELDDAPAVRMQRRRTSGAERFVELDDLAVEGEAARACRPIEYGRPDLERAGGRDVGVSGSARRCRVVTDDVVDQRFAFAIEDARRLGRGCSSNAAVDEFDELIEIARGDGDRVAAKQRKPRRAPRRDDALRDDVGEGLVLERASRRVKRLAELDLEAVAPCRAPCDMRPTNLFL